MPKSAASGVLNYVRFIVVASDSFFYYALRQCSIFYFQYFIFLFLFYFPRAITNKFWKETLFAYAKLTSTIVIDEMDCDSCSLWYSNESKFKQEEITQWKNRGLHNINDLLCETGRFLTFHEFKEKFDVRATSLDYLGLIQSLPRNLRMRHRSRRQPEPIIHPYVSNVLEKRQGAKQF